MNSLRRVNVAIDGLAASGKTTVAQALAQRLGNYTFLDTGLMYRSFALKCLRNATVPPLQLLPELDLRMEAASDGGCHIWLDGEPVLALLHSPEVSRMVPIVAAISEVRKELVARQQEFASGGGVIMVGRDIATVVMPQAEVKIFLECSLPERAQRRCLELLANGRAADPAEVKRDLAERDRQDSERADSPLICVPDAHRVDTTGKTRDEVLEELSRLIAAA